MGVDFGENLAKQRKKAGLSQEELAEKLHLTRQTISKWETGASLPDVEGLRALCRALDISIDEMMNGKTGQRQKWERLDIFQCFFYGFLIVMFVTGACVRMANQVNFEYYNPNITIAARVMMLVPAVVFFIMAAGRLRRKAQVQREKK